MKISKDAYNVVGGTRPGWSFQNNDLTNEELNETENENLKDIRQLKRELEIEKEKSKIISVFLFLFFYFIIQNILQYTYFILLIFL